MDLINTVFLNIMKVIRSITKSQVIIQLKQHILMLNQEIPIIIVLNHLVMCLFLKQ